VVLLLVHTKLSDRAPIRVLDLAAVDTVVIDDGASEEQLAMLRDAGPDVVVATAAEPSA